MDLTCEQLRPADDGYDAARTGWNLAVEHRPSLVVYPESVEDVVAAVEYARAEKLPVGVLNTGHGLVRPFADGVLIRLERLADVTVDPGGRTAIVGAGATWQHVLDACAPHGLAALSAFSSDVGAVGYTLGGGIGWLMRKYGACSDSVLSATVVLADGEVVTARIGDELFEAVCGGGGNFGVVTSVHMGLYDVDSVFAGGTYYPASRAPEVIAAYREWCASVPPEVTSALALVRFPASPKLPEPLRGADVVAFRACHTDGVAGVWELETMRTLGGELIDTFEVLPYSRIGEVAMGSRQPQARASYGALLVDLPDPLDVPALLDTDAPYLMVELRHVEGGNRPARPAGLGLWDAAYAVFSIAPTPSEEAAAEVGEYYRRLHGELGVCRSKSNTVNYLGTENIGDGAVRGCYTAEHFDRLTHAKSRFDPENVFCTNHNIAPGGTTRRSSV